MPQNRHAEPVTQPLTAKSNSAPGPLVVSRANPRYFAVWSAHAAAERAVYLTGSHIWNNLHDGMGPGADCTDRPEPFDFGAYLRKVIDTVPDLRASPDPDGFWPDRRNHARRDVVGHAAIRDV